MHSLHHESVTERQSRAATDRARRLRRLGIGLVERPEIEPSASPADPGPTPIPASPTEPEAGQVGPAPVLEVKPDPFEHCFWCGDLVSDRPFAPRRPKIAEIQRAVCEFYSVSLIDFLSSRRTAPLVLPRQVAMWICRHHTLHSLPEIGRRFGGRDHTTVLHAVRKMDDLVAKADPITRDIDSICKILGVSR